MKRQQLAGRVQKDIWTCRMNAKYHGRIAAEYNQLDRKLRLGVVMASVLVAASAGISPVVNTPWWQYVVAVAALITAGVGGYTVVLPPSDHIARHTELRQQWINLRYDLEHLLTDIKKSKDPLPDHILSARDRLTERMAGISKSEPPHPDQAKLNEAMEEVNKENGFKPKASPAPA